MFLGNKTKNIALAFGVKVIFAVWAKKSNMSPENQDSGWGLSTQACWTELVSTQLQTYQHVLFSLQNGQKQQKLVKGVLDPT